MKNIIIGTMSIVFLLFIIMISSTIYGRGARQTELETTLNSTMRQALEMLNEERETAPSSDEELVAVFTELFLQQVDSKSDAQVEILAADIEKRLLSVKATLNYNHLNGNLGTVTSTKTIVLEKYKNENGVIAFEYKNNTYLSDINDTITSTNVYYAGKDDTIPVYDDGIDRMWTLSEIIGTSDVQTEDGVTECEYLSEMIVVDNSGNEVQLLKGNVYSTSYLKTLKIASSKEYYSVSFME